MATFGKKNAGSAPTFGKRSSAASSAGVFGTPAHPSGKLSPEAKAFLDAERGLRGTVPAQANFPMPSSGLAASFQAHGQASKPSGKPVFGRRIIARIVDELLIVIPLGVMLLPSLSGAAAVLAEAAPGSPEAARANLEVMKCGAIIFLAQSLYGIIMESSAMQATLGKLMVGAVVTGPDGEKPSLGGVIMRNSLGRLMVNILPFLIGYVIGVFRADRRCLHDLVSNTMVRARVTAAHASPADVFA